MNPLIIAGWAYLVGAAITAGVVLGCAVADRHLIRARTGVLPYCGIAVVAVGAWPLAWLVTVLNRLLPPSGEKPARRR